MSKVFRFADVPLTRLGSLSKNQCKLILQSLRESHSDLVDELGLPAESRPVAEWRQAVIVIHKHCTADDAFSSVVLLPFDTCKFLIVPGDSQVPVFSVPQAADDTAADGGVNASAPGPVADKVASASSSSARAPAGAEFSVQPEISAISATTAGKPLGESASLVGSSCESSTHATPASQGARRTVSIGIAEPALAGNDAAPDLRKGEALKSGQLPATPETPNAGFDGLESDSDSDSDFWDSDEPGGGPLWSMSLVRRHERQSQSLLPASLVDELIDSSLADRGLLNFPTAAPPKLTPVAARMLAALREHGVTLPSTADALRRGTEPAQAALHRQGSIALTALALLRLVDLVRDPAIGGNDGKRLATSVKYVLLEYLEQAVVDVNWQRALLCVDADVARFIKHPRNHIAKQESLQQAFAAAATAAKRAAELRSPAKGKAESDDSGNGNGGGGGKRQRRRRGRGRANNNDNARPAAQGGADGDSGGANRGRSAERGGGGRRASSRSTSRGRGNDTPGSAQRRRQSGARDQQ